MQYLYHKESGRSTLLLKGDEHRYIFKVRRHREGEVMALRNLKDEKLYHYKIEHLDRKEAHLILDRTEVLVLKSKKSYILVGVLLIQKALKRYCQHSMRWGLNVLVLSIVNALKRVLNLILVVLKRYS